MFLILVALSTPTIIFLALICYFILAPWTKRKREFFTLPRQKYSTQDYFSNLIEKIEQKCQPNYSQPELYLSIIIPAMNEEDRLPLMLDETLFYLEKRKRTSKNFTYEIIVVDDGSHDKTSDVALKYRERYKTVDVLKLSQNIGKGGAVRCGVLCARGEMILFCDADGATKIFEVEKLEREMRRLCNGEEFSIKSDPKPIDWTHPTVICGSRAHLEKESIAKRSFIRTFLMYGFHALVYIFTVRSVRDTQCGFKLFSRAAASRLFPRMHIERWAFDVELLYLAEKLELSIGEVAVEWTEIDGSKVTPVISWIQMGRDIFLIWFRYTFGIWKIDELIE